MPQAAACKPETDICQHDTGSVLSKPDKRPYNTLTTVLASSELHAQARAACTARCQKSSSVCVQGSGMQQAGMQGHAMQQEQGLQGMQSYGPPDTSDGFQPRPDGAGEAPQQQQQQPQHPPQQQQQQQQQHDQQGSQQQQQQPVLPQQSQQHSMGQSGYPRGDGHNVEGKLFLGGLDNATTRQTLLDYVTQWCAAWFLAACWSRLPA